MFAFVRAGAHACFTSRRLHVCRNVCWRMTEVDQVVSEAPVRERAAFLLEFSTHASCLNHPFQCPLPGSDGGGNTDQLPFETCYYYHQRRQPSCPCAYSPLERDRRRISPFSLGNVYLCHSCAKGHGKALITGHDSKATTHYSLSVP